MHYLMPDHLDQQIPDILSTIDKSPTRHRSRDVRPHPTAMAVRKYTFEPTVLRTPTTIGAGPTAYFCLDCQLFRGPNKGEIKTGQVHASPICGHMFCEAHFKHRLPMCCGELYAVCNFCRDALVIECSVEMSECGHVVCLACVERYGNGGIYECCGIVYVC